MIGRFLKFITTDIWRIRLKTMPRKKSFLIKNLRIVILAMRGFNEDKCQLRASALTYYSLLSIVPVLAMAFGISKGFGFQKMLEKQLIEKLPGQEEIVSQMIAFAQSMLSNTSGGLIAGLGVFLLLYTVVKVLGNIEKSFNDIWGIKKGRGFGRRMSDYLSIMLVCPVLFIMSSSLTVLIASQIKLIVERISFLGPLSPLIFAGLKLLPFAVFWLLFTFIYIFMPNTKVNFRSGIIAGIAAGTVYEIVQWAYINFQVGVAKYNAIYGSFAALPLFLVWLQLSWLIVLLGAEISFAHQNVDTYEFEPDCLLISYSFKRILTLKVMHQVVMNFVKGSEAMSAAGLSHQLEIPIRLVRQILFDLGEAGLVSETCGEKEGALYLPGHDVNDLTISRVCSVLENKGIDSIPVKRSKELDVFSESLEVFAKTLEKSPANKKLKDI